MAGWAPPGGNLLDAMNLNEAICNGVWNNILSGWYFQNNSNWVVMPEYSMVSVDAPNTRLRPDLLICDTTVWPAPAGRPPRAGIPVPSLIFEGKFTGRDAKFDNAREQARNYMRVSDCKASMVALGRKVLFTTVTILRNDDRCLTVGRDGELAITSYARPLDIVNDQQTIHEILTLIAARRAIPVPQK
jgi:hypothetical protein